LHGARKELVGVVDSLQQHHGAAKLQVDGRIRVRTADRTLGGRDGLIRSTQLRFSEAENGQGRRRCAWVASGDFQRTTVECVGYAPNMETYRRLMETGWLRASRPVRLLGVGVRLSDTETVEQLSLFDERSERATH